MTVAQVREHRLQVGTLGLLGEAERARDGVQQEPWLAQRGKLDQTDTVGEAWRRRGRGAQREAALADAARAGHRDQPGLFNQRAQPGELCLPADEPGRLNGELPVLPPGGASEHGILTRSGTRLSFPVFLRPATGRSG